jgi:hypothetical protein
MNSIKYISIIFFLYIMFFHNDKSFGQNPDSLSFFPHNTGDTWEYSFFNTSMSFPDDTMQTQIVVDSIGSDGCTYITQIARSINPVEPPIFFFLDTNYFRIDSSQNVYGRYSEFQDTLLLIYKLNAQLGDKWIIFQYGTTGAAEMSIIRYQWIEYFWGKNRTFKSIFYYLAQDTTDTLGLVRYEDILIEGIGLYRRGGGDTFSLISLKGAVINGIQYGDTTNITSIDEYESIPVKVQNIKNSPNPFNHFTKIIFQLEKASSVSIFIFDANGGLIKTLFNNKYFVLGLHETYWSGLNSNNESVASGIYYLKIETDHYINFHKMTFLK